MIATHFFKRLVIILVGYLLVVLAAAITVSFILNLFFSFQLLVHKPFSASVHVDILATLAAISVFAAILVVMAAFPIWAIVAPVTERSGFRARYAYLLTGTLAALPFLIAKSSTPQDLLLLWVAGLSADLIVGLDTWRIAGRNARLWKQSPNAQVIN